MIVAREALEDSGDIPSGVTSNSECVFIGLWGVCEGGGNSSMILC